MITLLLGVLSSVAAEAITALNKKLAGTVLKGQASFILAALTALVASAIKIFYVDGAPLPSIHSLSSWQALAPAFTEVWTISQLYFILVMQWLGLDVQSVPAGPQTFGSTTTGTITSI